MSVRKAYAALRIDRPLYTYKSRRGDQAGLKQRIKEICETHVRYGYRRVHVLLTREGWFINMKRTRRLASHRLRPILPELGLHPPFRRLVTQRRGHAGEGVSRA